RTLSFEAGVLLEPLSSIEAIQISHAVPKEFTEPLDRAIELLRLAWNQLLLRDSPRIGAFVAANLLTALDIAGRKIEYEELLSQSLKVAPDFPHFLRRYARSMIDADDWTTALKAINDIPTENVEMLDRLLRIQCRSHAGFARDAIREAREFEKELRTDRLAEVAAAI